MSYQYFSIPYTKHKNYGTFNAENIFVPKQSILSMGLKPVVYPDVFYNNLYNNKRYDVWVGGNGSAKSTNKARQLLYKALDSSQYFRLLYLRHNFSDIEKTVYQLFKDVAKWENIENEFRFYDGSYLIKCKSNGHLMYPAGLDDTGKLSGIQEVSDIWFEEPITISKGKKVVMLDKEQFDDIDTRLRTPLAKHKFHMTLNPINKGFFLFKNLLDPDAKKEDILFDKSDFNICTSTYLDNPFLPEEYKKVVRNFKGARAMYGRDGVWAHETTGNEWLSSFDRNTHVKKVPFVKGIEVNLGHDFNLLPYQTMLCVQIVRSQKDGRTKVRVFKEYCLKPPRNVPEFCTEDFISDYLKPYGFHPVAIYGDASGRYGTDSYRGIFSAISHYTHANSDQISRRNPFVSSARDLINEMLEGKYNIDIEIDESCHNLIKDLESLQTGVKGFDPEVKDGVEQRGHCYSALVYIVCKIYYYLLKENLKN